MMLTLMLLVLLVSIFNKSFHLVACELEGGTQWRWNITLSIEADDGVLCGQVREKEKITGAASSFRASIFVYKCFFILFCFFFYCHLEAADGEIEPLWVIQTALQLLEQNSLVKLVSNALLLKRKRAHTPTCTRDRNDTILFFFQHCDVYQQGCAKKKFNPNRNMAYCSF